MPERAFFETSPLHPAARVVEMICGGHLGSPGCYAWFFGPEAVRRITGSVKTLPVFPVGRCCPRDGMLLLYIGTSSSRGVAAGREKPRSLRSRLKNHLLGTAACSTLRRSLGLLLGQSLCPHKSKFRLENEEELSRWMLANAWLCFAETPDPDVLEAAVLEQPRFFFPLNLKENTVLVSGGDIREKEWLLALRRLRRTAAS